MKNWYRKYGKRCIDLCIAIPLSLIAAPILVVVIPIVRITMGSPVFFVQKRIGFQEKEFLIYKLRTMTNARDKSGELLPDHMRLTWFGKFLRVTSIDELPQLWNVLIGDMSIIGPRPLLPRYLPYYKPTERLRHSVLPGVTGLAQVNGRNSLSWDSKLNYDVDYVKNVSLTSDLKIFCATVQKVIKGSDINADIDALDLEQERKSPVQSYKTAI